MISEQILIVLYLRPTQNESQVEINGQIVWIMILEFYAEVQKMRNRFKDVKLTQKSKKYDQLGNCPFSWLFQTASGHSGAFKTWRSLRVSDMVILKCVACF